MAAFVDGELETRKGTEGEQVNLGPLIGVERGFMTREKVPWSGGMGGVEMVFSPWKGKAKEVSGEDGADFDVDVDVDVDVASASASESSGRDSTPHRKFFLNSFMQR
jgi:hypothetical protein